MTDTQALLNLCICEIPFVNTYTAYPADYPMRNKGRYRGGMLYTVKGTEIYGFCDRTVHACPGSVLIIPEGESYSIHMNDSESVVIAIDFEVVQGQTFRPVFVKPTEGSRVKELFGEMQMLFNSNSDARAPIMKSVFYKIVSRLVMEEGSYMDSASKRKIEPSLEYLHGHYLESGFSVEKLAEISGISRRYFEKLFYKEFKTTPRDYIINLKTELAKELLRSEKNSVTDVAVSLGYNDIYHFSKIFKAKTGTSPAQYKRQSR